MLVAETIDVLAVHAGFEGVVTRRDGVHLCFVVANRVGDLTVAIMSVGRTWAQLEDNRVQATHVEVDVQIS